MYLNSNNEFRLFNTYCNLDAVEAEKYNLKSCNENRAVVQTHLGSPPEGEMNFFFD